MRTLTIAILVLVTGCMGCLDEKQHPAADPANVQQTQSQQIVGVNCNPTGGPVKFLCVGMERSRRFGACPGCEIDARRLSGIMTEKFGYEGDTLISEQATKDAVVSLLREGILDTPADGMFMFLYSGHGGQEYLGGEEPDGADVQDEFLCLYDTYMLDDEIWSIVSQCKGRVFLYFDACHSATMYRSVLLDNLSDEEKSSPRALEGDGLVWTSGFRMNIEDFLTAQVLESDGTVARTPNIRIQCWSGCKELEYSYGGSAGGVMTSALSRNWKRGMTYGRLWSLVVADVQKEQPTQHPVRTVIGNGFGDGVEAFK